MRTFELEYKIEFSNSSKTLRGTTKRKGWVFMTVAWKLQQELKKEWSKYDKGVNVFVNLNKENKQPSNWN